MRRRRAERAPPQHQDGPDDHEDEDVLARGREREQRAGIQDHAENIGVQEGLLDTVIQLSDNLADKCLRGTRDYARARYAKAIFGNEVYTSRLLCQRRRRRRRDRRTGDAVPRLPRFHYHFDTVVVHRL